jgi:hypothetical protein
MQIHNVKRGNLVIASWAGEAYRTLAILRLPAAAEVDALKSWLEGSRQELPKGRLERLGSDDAVFMFAGEHARALLREVDDTIFLFAVWSSAWPLSLFIPRHILNAITIKELADK